MPRGELLVGALLLAAFAPGVATLARVWASTDYQSHGFLVPLVSALVARHVDQTRPRLVRRRDVRGAALLGAGIALYAFGLAAGSPPAQGLAFVTAIAGAVWWWRGPAWLRALAFPIAFLLFMVPIPPAWLGPVVVRLLLFVSAASEAALHAIGAPIVREGNLIVLPGGEQLFVAEACSGLTSIVTLTPIAVLIAWLSLPGWGARAALVASVVPIAMAVNLLRVVGTVLASRAWGVAAVTGEPVHSTIGLAVYASGAFALLAVARGLARVSPVSSRRTAD